MESNCEKITKRFETLPDVEKFKGNEYTLEKVIGRAIARQLKKKGITQRALAESIFVSNSAISKMVTGNANPRIETLIKIAEYLGVSIDYLCGRTFDESSSITALNAICEHLYAGLSDITCDADGKTYHIPSARISAQLAAYWENKRKAERLRASATADIERLTADKEEETGKKNLLNAIQAEHKSHEFNFSECTYCVLIPKEKLTPEIAKFLENKL